ncbi:CAP domain-containing protein [Longitalea luteola]|uniref:CAP domain-containing protein n=1 Tax=Longitalea luteola TaxID=2812563 RepID=UPI001A97BAD0|nr:CAP domain-containing protein [Longitalea luteola]
MKHIFFPALLSFFVFEASSHPLTMPGKTAPAHVTAATVRAGMEDDILKYINAYRRKKGLRPLTMNAAISAEAQQHSENMAARRTSFGHNGFQGRVKRFSPAINGVSGVAENVALGSTTAKEVVDNWLKSAMHRKNIEGDYTLTGIGVAADKKGTLYFTQIFASN